MCEPIKNVEGDRSLTVGDAGNLVTFTDEKGNVTAFAADAATDLLLDLAGHIAKATGK